MRGCFGCNLGLRRLLLQVGQRTGGFLLLVQLCRQLLAVSAQFLMAGRGKQPVEFGDGVLTGRGTFQKYFDQAELRDWITMTLGEVPVAAAPGVFYVFREEGARESFVASR